MASVSTGGVRVFRILGPVEVTHAGAPVPVGGPRHRRLLAVLLLHPGEVVPADVLIDALWPAGPPRSARDVLHVRISELRAALRVGSGDRDAGLCHRDGGYELRVGRDGLDAEVFERFATAGARALDAGDPGRARSASAAALALWHGTALGEFADEPFARAAATRLETLRLQVLETRLAADLDTGHHDDVLPELEMLTARHPLRERFTALLMVALYRAGRQSEALAAYRSAAELLQTELGLDPGPELRRLEAAVLRQDPALNASAPTRDDGSDGQTDLAPDGNLPAGLTGFVGRSDDLDGVAGRLRTARLVTLTGVGGVGKSRLAVEVAAGMRDAFPGGVWLVDLAAVTQPKLVVLTIAATVGVREHPHRPPLDVLAARLEPAPTLLVLDNCEHLIDEVAAVADALLRSCPRLTIVATSRERLGVTGEHLWPVDGLSADDAVRLLTERVRAGQPAFRPTAALGEICRRLDGLPLALELAAASIQVLGVDEVARGLSDRFTLLTRGSRTALPRHRTLRAIVDWSYARLEPADRVLFGQLSVFVGGFTLPLAEAVCGAPVADRLGGLVDKSMVGFDSSRYRMLETLRAYGMERLHESGTADDLRHRHAAAVLALVKAARAAWQSGGQTVWLRRLEADNGNLRAALDWCVASGDAATALRLAGSLYPLWDRHGRYREGRRWLSLALALPSVSAAPASSTVPPIVRARALDSAAGLAVLQGDLASAGRDADEAAALSRAAGDDAGVARALTTVGLAAMYDGDYQRAGAVLDEALTHARAAGAAWPEAFALLYLASVAAATDDDALASRRLAECEPVMRAMGDPEALAALHILRGTLAWRAGDRPAAAADLQTSLRGYGRLGHVWGLTLGLYLAAELSAGAGRPGRAVSLLATSSALREAIGAALLPFVGVWTEDLLGRTREALGTVAFDAAWREGLGRRPEAALAVALEAAAEVSDRNSGSPRP